MAVTMPNFVQPELPFDEYPLVGLVGRKRAGKDTVAARLVEKHGFVRLAFADRLKKLALTVDPLVADWHSEARLSEVVAENGWEGAKERSDVRQLLQRLGTAIRDIQRDFWVAPVLAAAKAARRPVVITDVRFTNEADAIEAAGGILIRVDRPGIDRSDTHISETQLDDRNCAWRLYNGDTIDGLKHRVDLLATLVFDSQLPQA